MDSSDLARAGRHTECEACIRRVTSAAEEKEKAEQREKEVKERVNWENSFADLLKEFGEGPMNPLASMSLYGRLDQT